MIDRFLVSGPFRLDLVDERLWRDGETVPLGAKALALLRLFMTSPQILLTKDQLLDEIWGAREVGESVLTTAIKDLRRALGDDARDPKIIRTVHGRGYTYMLPVEAQAAPEPETVPQVRVSPTSPARRGLLLAGIVVAAAAGAAGVGFYALRPKPAKTASDKSLAVLPFRDLSEGGDQAWLADGLTEEVLNSLSRTPDLRVVSRKSSQRFRGQKADPRDIARQLSVAHLLEGTVRRSGDRLRVGVSLIRVADQTHVWSKTYDRRGADLISIQEDVAYDIARALKTVLEPAKLRAMVETGTRSVDAYESYLRALALEQQNMAQGDQAYARAAAEAFDEARAQDPDFAQAHWRAAQSWYGNITRIDSSARDDVPLPERRRQYLLRVNAAIAASRDDVERLKYQAGAASTELRIRQAHALLARYLTARPRDLDAWDEMSDLASYVSDREWVARSATALHTLSMQDGLPLSRAITVSVHAQDPAATRRADEQLAVRPDNATTQYQAHRAYLTAGQIEKARAVLVRVKASGMNPWSRDLADLRQACAEHRVADARRLRAQIEASGQLSPRWHAAQVTGDDARAVAILRRYDNPEGLTTLMQFLVYPSFDARPFPNLTRLLQREQIKRPPPVALPYACKL